MNLESFCCVYLSFMKISLAMTSNKYCTLPVQSFFPPPYTAFINVNR